MTLVSAPETDDRLPLLDAVIAAIAAVALLIAGGGLMLSIGGAGVAIAQVVFVAGPVVVLALRRGGALSRLGVRNPGSSAVIGAVLIGASLWFLTLWLIAPLSQMWFDTSDLQELEAAAVSLPVPVMLLCFALAPAVCEELLFRAALARSLMPHVGRVGAVLISAVLFAGFHASAVRLLPTLFIGLALGAVCVRTRSVIPAMIVHALNNGIALSIAATGGDWLDDHSVALGISAIALTSLGFWLVWRPFRRRNK